MNVTNKFLVSAIAISVLSGCQSSTLEQSKRQAVNTNISFVDVSNKIGLISQPAWKYGGPSVSDINNDGYYDFLLTNHDTTPIRLFMANGDNTYIRSKDIFNKADLHGISAGDYDLDGDNDVLISLGGGNGTKPQPQRLLRNDNGVFVDVTVEAGISEMGARGRSVRWVDLDNDGDLDFLQINAEKVVNEEAPRNILFENNGDSTFSYRENSEFEDIDAERLLITDINNDHIADFIAFTPYSEASVWLGNNDFTFKNVTKEYFPKGSDNYKSVVSVAQADIDNDGDLDYYFARGKLHYTIANNSISFNEKLGRLDIRDEGNKSHDGITLHAEGGVELSDFYHFPRARLLKNMPVFLGANKAEIETPTSSVTVTQKQALGFPEKIDKTGWYLGYTGEDTWRLEWMLTDNLAWDVRASIKGLTNYTPDWTPQNRNVQDVLLRNDGDTFTDISNVLPQETNDNNWGVTPGDFNNDGFNDFFVYRFGGLKERIADVMLINNGNNTFTTKVMKSATTKLGQDSHGDMGTAFDYNLDGKIDILSGDDDNGLWHMYENNTDMADNHYILTRIGYSPTGIDPISAKVTITTDTGSQTKLIGSTSASHSQSVLNIAHFGLAQDKLVKSINVRWRDGSETNLSNVKGDSLTFIGTAKP